MDDASARSARRPRQLLPLALAVALPCAAGCRRGGEAEVTGVGGKAVARPVRVGSQRRGGIEIPAATLDALEMSGGDGKSGLQGLLDSDTLNRFHRPSTSATRMSGSSSAPARPADS